ncbi:MAG: HDOD domain-containing protein [Planctomycetota bacterium]
MIDAPRPTKITPNWVDQQLRQRLDRVLSPAVGTAVLRELGRAEANFRTVADLLQADPYLTGRFIAVAELARADSPEPLRNVEDAVRLLGLKNAESLLLSVMLIGPLASDIVAVHAREDVWAWSIGCGIAADLLAQNAHPGDDIQPLPAHAGLVDGLMLGLGVLVLLAGVGWPYQQTLGPQLRPAQLADDERNDFGVTHYQTTGWALQAIGCPSHLAGSSNALADPDKVYTPDASFGYAVELLAAKLAGFQQAVVDETLGTLLPEFGIDYDALQRTVLSEGQRRLRSMMQAFGEADDTPDHRGLSQRAGNALASQVEDAVRRRSA